MREYLKNLAIYCEGDYHKITTLLEKRLNVPSINISTSFICIGDKLYPKMLYDLECPPYVLFYDGDISLLKRKSISIVGSRVPSMYAIDTTQKFVEKLRNDYVIVSGLAKGIDATAHRASLDFSTIAVLGCGIDVVYPKENTKLFEVMRKNHLIISEYPPGVTPKRHYFPFRNRIIAALSDKLLVMSATLKSGTMTTVNEALSINRHVLCLPHQIDVPSGKGCNQLILEGADILTSINDI